MTPDSPLERSGRPATTPIRVAQPTSPEEISADSETELALSWEPETGTEKSSTPLTASAADAPLAPRVIKPRQPTPAASSASPISSSQPAPSIKSVSSSSTPPASELRTARPMITSTPPSSTAQPSISDLRRNAERQSREQNSVTRLLAILGYTFLGGLVLVAGLAAYGGYVIFGRLNQQSATLAQLESTMQSETRSLRDDLKAAQDELGSTRRTVQQQQVTLTRQQDQVAKLSADLRARAKEIADLRARGTR